MQQPTNQPTRGFTLIELLVVISIIALLVAILLPSLRRARDQGKLAVCASNLRELGLGVHMYAGENNGRLPTGPAPPQAPPPIPDFCFACNNTSTNQLWTSRNDPFAPAVLTGLAPMLHTTIQDARVFFCPADNNFNLAEESPKIGDPASDAFGSYIARQLDMLPPAARAGRLDQMGANIVGGVSVRVEALAWDAQSLGDKPTPANPQSNTYHTNHNNRESNILFRDASVRRVANTNDIMSIPNSAFKQAAVGNIAPLRKSLDQIAINADFAYRGSPTDAPHLP